MHRWKPQETTTRLRPFAETGFTLIELLVTVAILGILATLAVPSYQDYIRRGNRAEAKGILLEAAQYMERVYSTNNCYHRTDTTCGSAANLSLPAGLNQSPKTGTAKYNIAVSFPSTSPCTLGQCFTLTATPTGTMAGDACGALTLTHAGTKGVGGSTVADCWQR